MPNPLFTQLMNGAKAHTSIPGAGNIANIMQQVNALASSFRGNPRAEVEKLISSGQMSQAEFNELAQMANTIMGKAQRQ